MSQKISETFDFVCLILKSFGIQYFTPETLRVGKFPNQSNSQILQQYQRLIFDLCILHMSNFSFKLSEINIQIIDYNEMNKFSLYYLNHINCPFIIFTETQDNIFINFNDQRDLLLIVGWIFAMADIFNLYQTQFLEKTTQKIENVNGNFMDQYLEQIEKEEKNNLTDKNDTKVQSIIQENMNQYDQFLELYKRVQFSFQKLEGLNKRKCIKKYKLQEMFGQGSTSNLKDFLIAKNPQFLQDQIEQLIVANELLEKQMKSMRHHEIFWQWIETVIDNDKKEYQDDPDYGFQDEQNNVFQLKGDQKIIEVDTLIQNFQNLSETIDEIQEKYQKYNELWSIISQNEIKKDVQQLEQLKQCSAGIIETLDTKKIPNYDKFKTNFDYNYKTSFNETLFSYYFHQYINQPVQVKSDQINQSQKQNQIQNPEKQKNSQLLRINQEIQENYNQELSQAKQCISKIEKQLNDIITIFPKKEIM